MGLRTFLRLRRERSLGQSLVEFALILPVFLVILSVALDLGRLAYARVTIANVAREASFQAAQTPTSYQAGQPCATDTNMVICRGILESKGSVVTVNPADITLTCTPSCADADTMGDVVTVKATGTFNLLTPVMAVFFGGTTITFSSSATNQVSVVELFGERAGPEFVFAGFDGRIHAVDARADEIWSYVYTTSDRVLTAGVAVADLSGDGAPEIVFATYSPDDAVSELVILDGGGDHRAWDLHDRELQPERLHQYALGGLQHPR